MHSLSFFPSSFHFHPANSFLQCKRKWRVNVYMQCRPRIVTEHIALSRRNIHGLAACANPAWRHLTWSLCLTPYPLGGACIIYPWSLVRVWPLQVAKRNPVMCLKMMSRENARQRTASLPNIRLIPFASLATCSFLHFYSYTQQLFIHSQRHIYWGGNRTCGNCYGTPGI